MKEVYILVNEKNTIQGFGDYQNSLTFAQDYYSSEPITEAISPVFATRELCEQFKETHSEFLASKVMGFQVHDSLDSIQYVRKTPVVNKVPDVKYIEDKMDGIAERMGESVKNFIEMCGDLESDLGYKYVPIYEVFMELIIQYKTFENILNSSKYKIKVLYMNDMLKDSYRETLGSLSDKDREYAKYENISDMLDHYVNNDIIELENVKLNDNETMKYSLGLFIYITDDVKKEAIFNVLSKYLNGIDVSMLENDFIVLL